MGNGHTVAELHQSRSCKPAWGFVFNDVLGRIQQKETSFTSESSVVVNV